VIQESIKSTDGGASSRQARLHYAIVRIAVLILVGGVGTAALSGTARAQDFCWFNGVSTPQISQVSFNVQQTISLQKWATDHIITSASGSLSMPAGLYCTSSTVPGGLTGVTPASGPNHLFTTGIPGVAFRIIFGSGSTGLTSITDSPSTPLPVSSMGDGSFQFNASQAHLQLVYTGAFLGLYSSAAKILPTSNRELSGSFGQWRINFCHGTVQPDNGGYACNGQITSVVLFDFNTAGKVHFTAPTCDVDQTSVTVNMPIVVTSQFTGLTSSTGKIPFQIGLHNCSANLEVDLILHSDEQWSSGSAAGVIDPQSDQAKGVGIQILKQDGSTPISFDTVINTGTTTNSGVYAIQLFAQYYQTAQSVTAGEVHATAKYSLTYR